MIYSLVLIFQDRKRCAKARRNGKILIDKPRPFKQLHKTLVNSCIMRFIEDLSQETQSILQSIYKCSQHYRVRQRAHCILLSSKGYTPTQLQEIFQVDRITIYHWFHAWETRRLGGLYERKGRGRPPKLTEAHKEQIRQWAKDFPRNLHQIRLLIHDRALLHVGGGLYLHLKQRFEGAIDPG